MKRFAWIALSLLLVSAAAMAQDDGRGAARLHGRGALFARGEGDVKLLGDGEFALRGEGTITLRGVARNQFRVRGMELVQHDEHTWVFEGRGVVRLRARHFEMEFTGKVGRLVAVGKGTAWLRGEGVYRTRHGHGRWTPEGVSVEYE